MALELETLEVLLKVNTEHIKQSISKVMPDINSLMSKIEGTTGRSMAKTERSLDISDTVKKLENTFSKFSSSFEKQLDRLETTSKQKSSAVASNMQQGFKRTRTQAGKEVDLMIKDIDAKMGQAKAAQARIANLTAKRATSSGNKDTDSVVKYDSQIANAEKQMTSYRNSALKMARDIKREFEEVPATLDNITKSMDQNEPRIETMRRKIEQMKKKEVSSRKMTGNFKEGFGSVESDESLKLAEKIQIQVSKMNKLVSENDNLQQAYAQTEERARSLKSTVERLSNSYGKNSIQTGNAAQGMKKTSRMSEIAHSSWSRFGGVFNRVSNAIAHGTRRTTAGMGSFFNMFNRSTKGAVRNTNQLSRGTSGFSRILGQLSRRIFVYGILYKGIMSLAGGMMKSLKTNEQFASSLNQIQVNLMTAFYPIYQAILPVINALMSALAKATGYMASFIATMFGTTYSAAKKGAEGLYDNVQAMEDTGKGAKEAQEKVKELQNSLMGFDEINRIGLDVGKEDKLDSGNKNKIDFGIPDVQTPKWLTDFAERAKSILSRLFEPMQAGWKKSGQAVMDAWKYALGEVIGLSKSIGSSFMDVWTNGTGALFISNILELLATALNILGDIAGAFRRAWDDEGRGTALIQSYFDKWNSILSLLKTLGDTFRTVWNDGTGEIIAGNILEIYTNVNGIITGLVTGFEDAWKEAGNGEGIMGSLLGYIEDISEFIKDVTQSTKEWAENLDFGPVLSSVKDMLKEIEPVLNNALDELKWLYDEVLLPIGKWAMESFIPSAIDAISEAFRFLGNMANAAQPALEWIWEKFLKPIGKWVGNHLIGELESISFWFGFLADAVEAPKKAFDGLKDSFVEKAKGIWGNTKEFFGKTKDSMTENIKKGTGLSEEEILGLEVSSSNAFGGMWNVVKKLFPSMNRDITDNSTKASRSASDRFDDMKKNMGNRTQEIWTDTKGKFSDVQKWIADKSGNARQDASNSFSTMKSNVGSRLSEIWTSTKDNWDNVSSKVTSKSSEARINAVNSFSNMKSGVGGYLTGIKDTTRTTFDQVAGWASGLGERIAKGLRGGVQAVKNAAASIGNGIVGVIGKAMNGVISGINWVLDKVGAGKSKLGGWAIPKYASGTDGHPGGMAMVNDGTGSKYREAFQLPGGQTGLFPEQRNMLVNLPKGSKVLSGPKTHAMYGDTPHYAGGIGDWMKEKWNGAKEMAGNVWDYVSNPSKLVDIAISKFVNLSKSVEPALSMAKGGISTISKGATDFVKGFLNQGPADGGYSGGVNFPGLVKTDSFGYRIHPITGQRTLHRGVDYGGGMGIGHPIHAQQPGRVTSAGPTSGGYGTAVKMTNGIFDYLYAHLSRTLVRPGEQVSKGNKIGLMGNTGMSTGPHIHYEVHKNGQPINPEQSLEGSGGSGPSTAGEGAGRWRSTILKALSMNGLPTSVEYVNAWMRQIQTESGGNEKAVQSPNVVDINTLMGNPAKGLLQTIPQTFNAYKFPGHGDIFNGYHNSLAAINYAKNRYGASGMLGVIGKGHGYENGGIVSKEGQYTLAEGNKKELIIPLERRNRALELLDVARDYLGVNETANLQMPSLFLESPTSRFNTPTMTRDMGTGGLSGITDAVIQAMSSSSQDKNGRPVEITMELDKRTIAKVVIDVMNEMIDNTGKIPLNI